MGLIMRLYRLKTVRGYKYPRRIAGQPPVVALNPVQRRFSCSGH